MNKKSVEESDALALSFDKNGLLPVIVQDMESSKILMLAYVNEQAFRVTLTTGYATFWSRSRKSLWTKGETSGNKIKVLEILVDCDQDSLIFKVEKVGGGVCHTKNISGNYRESCFYRRIQVPETKLYKTEE